MKRKAKAKHGFGLIETLLALFLFALVLVILADLVNGYRAMIGHSEGRSRTLKTAQVALAQLRSDVRAAARVVAPTSGTSQVLQLERLISGLSPRLPATVPTTPPTSWAILAPGHLYRLDYLLDQGRLVRDIAGDKLVLATEIDNFEVKIDGAQFQFTLVVKEQIRDFTLVSRVSRP